MTEETVRVLRADVETVLREQTHPLDLQAEADYAHALERLAAALEPTNTKEP